MALPATPPGPTSISPLRVRRGVMLTAPAIACDASATARATVVAAVVAAMFALPYSSVAMAVKLHRVPVPA